MTKGGIGEVCTQKTVALNCYTCKSEYKAQAPAKEQVVKI
jgi:hypothetical protein